MPDAIEQISVVSGMTLGKALSEKRLFVDVNQRSYAWGDKQVRDLYEDFRAAVERGPTAEHFLGTIIVTRESNGTSKIVDGQQRLATTLILFAAMRDYFHNNSERERSRTYEGKYLISTDPDSLASTPHLSLNGLDNAFFKNHVILAPSDDVRRTIKANRASHDLIAEASEKAYETVLSIVKQATPSTAVERIAAWRTFIESRARVLWVEVPDDNTAFVIFETMNDRGVPLSQADLLKNYLFAISRERMAEAQENWFTMVGALDTAKEPKEILVTYIRHLWIATRTHVVAKGLYSEIKSHVRTTDDAVKLADDLARNAVTYSAMMHPQHETWKPYRATVRNSIAMFEFLDVVQLRPLILAIVKNFSKVEVAIALRRLVNWSVRFLVSGGGGGGLVETRYGKAAQAINENAIKDSKDLLATLIDIVPSDAVFEPDFAKARVRGYMARYYLRAMEGTLKKETDPQLAAYEDEEKVNLEHIMPYSVRAVAAPAAWKHIDAETRRAYLTRLGNLALTRVVANAKMGDKGFTIKRPVLGASEFALTKEIAKKGDWGPNEIDARQLRLAKLAVKTWPIR